MGQYTPTDIIAKLTDMKVYVRNIGTAITELGQVTVPEDAVLADMKYYLRGQTPPQKYDEVNFLDYDGTVLYRYSASDFLDLAAMPENPVHDGLVSSGWNWTLADAQSHVQTYGYLDIGQMYGTSDNTTRIYITVPSDNWTLDTLYVYGLERAPLIDWGDGSTTSTEDASYVHTYASAGNYTIKVTNNNRGFNDSVRTIIIASLPQGETAATGSFPSSITAVETAQYVDIAFPGSVNMKYITLNPTIGDYYKGGDYGQIKPYGLSGCISLKSITFPAGYFVTGTSAFNGCTSLETISTKQTYYSNHAFDGDVKLAHVTGYLVNSNAGSSLQHMDCFTGCSALERITGDFEAPIYGVSTCDSLSYVNIDQGTISSYQFDSCPSLETIKLQTVSWINAYAFNDLPSLTDLYLYCETPPTLGTYFGNEWFSGTTDVSKITVHILSGTMSLYQSSNWSGLGLTFVEDL